MKEGYLAGREEDKQLLHDFKHVDMSNWDDC